MFKNNMKVFDSTLFQKCFQMLWGQNHYVHLLYLAGEGVEGLKSSLGKESEKQELLN